LQKKSINVQNGETEYEESDEGNSAVSCAGGTYVHDEGDDYDDDTPLAVPLVLNKAAMHVL
jgi:hypothetical protein